VFLPKGCETHDVEGAARTERPVQALQQRVTSIIREDAEVTVDEQSRLVEPSIFERASSWRR
jgi:hypothetical protein